VENAPLMARFSLLFSFVRMDSDRHFSKSMVLTSLSPPSFRVVHSVGDPLLSPSEVESSDDMANCSYLGELTYMRVDHVDKLLIPPIK
jgi:hypothetical protein